MRDLIRAKVVKAELRVMKMHDTDVIDLTYEPQEPVIFQGKEVHLLHSYVSQQNDWDQRRAQLRHALWLEVVNPRKGNFVEINRFTKQDIPAIIGKELLLSVETDRIPEHGSILRVDDFYPLHDGA